MITDWKNKSIINIKIILTLLFIISVSFCFSQTKKIINGIEFEFISKTDSDNFSDGKEFVEIFRKNKKLITHTIYELIGDCSSENLELGTYEIVNNTIHFYSYWASTDRMGQNIYPFGFRKQIYSVNKNGIIYLISSKLYIEDFPNSFEIPSNIKTPDDYNNYRANYIYLLSKKSKKIKSYLSTIEKMYAGEFVFGKEKEKLENEVRLKLKEKIELHTDGWEKYYKTYNK